MNFKFDLPDLQAFAAVARFSSFRAAAAALHLSQPALSRRIDKLEIALGVKLLERSTRHVRLSSVGREFARKNQAWLDELEATLLSVDDLAAQRVGLVTVACVPSATRYFMPAVLRRFHERFPKIRVRIHDAHAGEVLEAVAQGVADFGVNFIGKKEPALQFTPLLTERFVLACPSNRQLLDQALAALPQRPQPVFESRHVQTLLGMVEAGLGVAAVPQMAMPRHNDVLCAVPLKAPVVHRQLGLSTRRGQSLPPTAAQLHDFLLALKTG
jgi:DNA-binding transcriptional LysR family regulator